MSKLKLDQQASLQNRENGWSGNLQSGKLYSGKRRGAR